MRCWIIRHWSRVFLRLFCLASPVWLWLSYWPSLAFCPTERRQQPITLPQHRVRSSVWRGAGTEWVCQAPTSSGRHSKENPFTGLQDSKFRRVIIFRSTWLLSPKSFQKACSSLTPCQAWFQDREAREELLIPAQLYFYLECFFLHRPWLAPSGLR